jgi:hypothetical protein
MARIVNKQVKSSKTISPRTICSGNCSMYEYTDSILQHAKKMCSSDTVSSSIGFTITKSTYKLRKN